MECALTVEDAKTFKDILERDPECRKCFECGSPFPQWCDTNHAIFICLECSGVHRSLGVHLSFVRSSTLDEWSTWNPIKLKQMKIGGNRRARLYFEANGIAAVPIREKYKTEAAIRYAAMLESEANGQTFNERTWTPPEWYHRMKQAGSPAGSASGQFQGFGSSTNTAPAPSGWYSSLSSGWNSVAQRTSELAQQAAAQAEKLVQEADVDTVKDKFAWGFGAMTSYATQLSSKVTSVANSYTGSGEEDVLSDLRRHAQQAEQESQRGSAAVTGGTGRFGRVEGPTPSASAGVGRMQAGGNPAGGSASSPSTPPPTSSSGAWREETRATSATSTPLVMASPNTNYGPSTGRGETTRNAPSAVRTVNTVPKTADSDDWAWGDE